MIDKHLTVGRYAPSPTGDLHLGNLRTAMLAWLQARLEDGQFLLRMEDLDQPRVVAGSADQILRDLEWLGLDWDGEVIYQSQRNDAYQDAIESLERQNLVYPCFCSRKDIQAAVSAPHMRQAVYAGTCQSLTEQEREEKVLLKNPAIRVRVSTQLQTEVGDFAIKRADKLFAYQLAVVVDDLYQGINQVVRGADLLDSCSRQQYLTEKLAPVKPHIEYLHAPLMLDEKGHRMAKRDGSASVRRWRAENKTSEQLIAHLFNSLNLGAVGVSISLNELLYKLDEDSFTSLWVDRCQA